MVMKQRFDEEGVSEAFLQTQRLAGIGTLTASVAHELTNPINIITATCHNLLSQIAEENLSQEELVHYVEMIDHSAWRCARLIETLRNYSHIDGLQVATCDLNTLIEDSLRLVSYQLERQYNIDIETDLAPDLEPLRCDQNQITQVLVNLLINARDALQDQGLISIRTWALSGENAQAFSVSDTGSGIHPDHLDRVFEPFFTTKPIGEGTGLGLAIVARIVSQHDGRIWAANNPAAGATFTVVLPCFQSELGSNGETGSRPSILGETT